jgi:hypothetical protein
MVGYQRSHSPCLIRGTYTGLFCIQRVLRYNSTQDCVASSYLTARLSDVSSALLLPSWISIQSLKHGYKAHTMQYHGRAGTFAHVHRKFSGVLIRYNRRPMQARGRVEQRRPQFSRHEVRPHPHRVLPRFFKDLRILPYPSYRPLIMELHQPQFSRSPSQHQQATG